MISVPQSRSLRLNRPGSNAELAGLIDGQELVRLQVRYNAPTRPARVTIRAGDGALLRVISYPAGDAVIVPQFIFLRGLNRAYQFHGLSYDLEYKNPFSSLKPN